MKIVKNVFFIIGVIILLLPICVNANVMCKDGTYSPSCSTCGRGCCSHHGGCATISSKKNINNSNKKFNNKKKASNKKSVSNKITNVVKKSNDATLKSVIINDNNVNIVDNIIVFHTDKDKVIINPIANHKGANINYEKNIRVTKGTYKTKIKVIADDKKTTKEYIVKIRRLFDNTDIEVFVNGQKVFLIMEILVKLLIYIKI